MAPLVEAISNTNTDGTANNAISLLSTPSRNIKDHEIYPQYNERSKENVPSAKTVISCSPSRSPGLIHRIPAQEKPVISLITAIPPSISNLSSSALTTPSTAASSSMTVGLISGGPKPNSPAIMDEKQPKLPNISSAVGEQLNASNGHLPSLAPSSTHGSSAFPSFHHHHHHHRPSSFLQPGCNPPSQPMKSPFPSPDAMSSRREEFLPRPFSYTTPTALQHSPSMPFSEGSELDEDGRSRKRYGRPPGAKDKRPRRRRTKAQMEEDALIYGYRDSESVYHSPNSLKRRRLSPRRDSLDDSPQEDSNSPPPQPVYTYPAFNPFPGAQPTSHQSPTTNFNPFLHRHHLPVSSGNAAPALPALQNNSNLSSSRHGSDPVWPPRAAEPDRIPSVPIPDSRPGAGDFGPSRYPPSPVGPSGFSSINARRSSENLRQPLSFHGEQSESRGRDLAPHHSPIPQEQGREPVIKWEHPSSSQNTLPRLGELPRLTDIQLDRPRWDRPDDLSRKQDFDRRAGGHENKLPSIPPLHTGHILNGPPHADINANQRGSGSPGSSRPQFPDILRTAPEPLAAGGDRLLIREGRAGSITNISVGPPLEAETPKRDEEDTDEQIEEYRARMLEKHSSYYNGTSGKPRVKREPSYAMPSKSPLQEENERLRAAIQRYRQQKGIERLKLEEFINKRCNGEQGMIKELLTITGHIAEDDYVGPVKPACL
ncbi:hypothetical protein TWF569_000726 [Orbilia oligospora]|uniref:Uncharacterized protein n=1 Tax=Orbilia oligospora TaxID=2813651 RepID=A0A7C8JLH1_ORBOL|nr:hypothetical protein TWF103_001893 [Orbilia oligospora]KAF3097794.1 hypothetical protein TWF102_006301 [Orbilia oligospora]KAF3104108.1 hypothetical protein TWF706_004581 [Orbilia oligospora]KAF3119432.1 hypothetical protein TWF594_004887 [Orbilia oligospora]KAF3123977.1 hypothetical protein TWF703_000553 [Orbilia oligospora]